MSDSFFVEISEAFAYVFSYCQCNIRHKILL